MAIAAAVVLPSCCADSDSGPSTLIKARLLGAQDVLHEAGGDVLVFESGQGFRWRVESAEIRGAYILTLTDAHQRVLTFPAKVDSGFVRAAHVAGLGDYVARLRAADGSELDCGVRLVPPLSEDPVVAAFTGRALKAGPAWIDYFQTSTHELSSWSRARLSRWMGRQAYLKKDPGLARNLWRAGTLGAARAESPKSVIGLLVSMAYLDINRGALVNAARLIDDADAILKQSRTEVGGALFEMRAMIEWRRGRPEAALRMSQEALRRAIRNGDGPSRARIQQALGVNLVQTGRYEAGLEILALAVKNSIGSDGVFARANEAWALLRATEAGLRGERWPAHRSRLKALLPALKDASYGAVRAEVLAELVYVELRDAKPDAAQASMRELNKVGPSELAGSAHFVALVQAQLAIKTGNSTSAIARLSALVSELSTETRVSPDELSALVLLSDLQSSTERKIEVLQKGWTRVLAGAHYLEAPDSKSHYFHLARELPLRLSTLLAESGRPELGAQVLLEARALLLTELAAAQLLAREPDLYASVVQRRQVAKAKSNIDCEGNAPKAREACHRLKAEARTLAIQASQEFFAQLPHRPDGGGGLAALRKRLVKGQALLLCQSDPVTPVCFLVTKTSTHFSSGQLPGAWLQRLEALSRLYVMGSPDLSVLAPPGTPLAGQIEVVHLIAGAGPRPVQSWASPLLVVDPNGDLPKSRAQGISLAKDLRTSPLVGLEARRRPVQARLRARPELFIHIGHGAVSDRAHWSTELRLVDGSLDAFSVLTEGLSGRLVILAGCSTGMTQGGQGMGLPEVFILGGADAVLATVSSVQDGDAVPFVERFLSAGAQANPARAFKEAVQQSVAVKDPVWKRFRLWVRE